MPMILRKYLALRNRYINEIARRRGRGPIEKPTFYCEIESFLRESAIDAEMRAKGLCAMLFSVVRLDRAGDYLFPK